jgi:tetratricopeptide (TPR) repeat protein
MYTLLGTQNIDSPRCRPRASLIGAAVLLAACLHGCGESEPQNPPRLEALQRQAFAAIGRGQLDSAASAFQQVMSLDESNYEARLGFGEVRMRQGRYDEAAAVLDEARRINPQRPEARVQLARTWMRLERPGEAIDLLQGVVVDSPEQIGAHMLLADLLMTRAPPDPQGALAQYEQVLAQRPDYRLARAGAAASRLRVGQFEAAAAGLEELVGETPGDDDLTFYLGTAFFWLGDYEHAVDAYRTAVDALPPGSPRLPVRKWNLRTAWRAAYGDLPLPESYRLALTDLSRPSPVHFTDVAAAVGVARADRSRGSAWSDVDGDGDLDLFTVGIQVPHALYLGDGAGGFTDVTTGAGLQDPRGGWSATAADYDNDGDADFYVTRDAWEGRAPNSLYRNDRGATPGFAEADAGVADPDDSFTAAWADINGDGWVDLYVADGITGSGAANKLYVNQRNGRFDERAAQMGAALTGKSLGVAFGDYDGDGDLDLYVANLAGPNALLRNEAGEHFLDYTDVAGVERPLQGGYVTFFTDYDADGDLDLFVSTMCYYEQFVESQVTGVAAGPRAHFYRNDNDSRFVEVGAELGLQRSFGSMGAGYGDVDYDGLVDLYLANGGPMLARLEPNILYHNQGDGFADITESAGVGNLGKGHGVTFADYDNDGDLDLYAGVGGHYPGDLWANSLYRNDGHANHWIAFDLRSHGSTIGARLVLRAGDHVATAQISSGDGFGSTNSPAVEFGLGPRQVVDVVEIHWPSGHVQQLSTPAVDRVHTIVESPGQ